MASSQPVCIRTPLDLSAVVQVWLTALLKTLGNKSTWTFPKTGKRERTFGRESSRPWESYSQGMYKLQHLQLLGRTEALAGARQGSFLPPVDTTHLSTGIPFPPTSHMRLLFLQISTCSGAMTRPVKGPISVPALIHVLEKMPRPSPGMELWAIITSTGSTRLDSFCTSARIRGSRSYLRRDGPALPIPDARSPCFAPVSTSSPNSLQWQISPVALCRPMRRGSTSFYNPGPSVPTKRKRCMMVLLFFLWAESYWGSNPNPCV